MPFVLRRSADAREEAERAQQPERSGDRKIRDVVNLAEAPLPGSDGPCQAGGVEKSEGHHGAPRERVADPPIQRVRPVLGEANDVGRGLDTRQLPEQPAIPVTTSTTASHTAMRQSKPCANKSKVSGPGAMKKVQIQIGQWFSR